MLPSNQHSQELILNHLLFLWVRTVLTDGFHVIGGIQLLSESFHQRIPVVLEHGVTQRRFLLTILILVEVVLVWLIFLELLHLLIEMRSLKHYLILVHLVDLRLIFAYFRHYGGFSCDYVGSFRRGLGIVVIWSLESVLKLVYFLEELFFFDCVDVVIFVQLGSYLVSFVQQLLICLF